jgi:hypothetical protein
VGTEEPGASGDYGRGEGVMAGKKQRGPYQEIQDLVNYLNGTCGGPGDLGIWSFTGSGRRCSFSR